MSRSPMDPEGRLWDASLVTNERLRKAFRDAGLRYEQVATALEVDPKTVERWVTQGRVPYPRHRYRIVEMVNVPEGDLWPELAERLAPDDMLSGEWWATWQTSREGQEVITVQPVRLDQIGDSVHIENLEPGVPVGGGDFPAGTSAEAADYYWRGELRLWHRTTLMGWYASRTPGIRSHGTLFLRLHPHAVDAVGRWVGESYDGPIVTGWGALARTQEAAETVIRHAIEHGLNESI